MYIVYLKRPLVVAESRVIMHEMPGSVHIFTKYSHLPVSRPALQLLPASTQWMLQPIMRINERVPGKAASLP